MKLSNLIEKKDDLILFEKQTSPFFCLFSAWDSGGVGGGLGVEGKADLVLSGGSFSSLCRRLASMLTCGDIRFYFRL